MKNKIRGDKMDEDLKIYIRRKAEDWAEKYKAEFEAVYGVPFKEFDERCDTGSVCRSIRGEENPAPNFL